MWPCVTLGNTAPLGPIVFKSARTVENEFEVPVCAVRASSFKDHSCSRSIGEFAVETLDVVGISRSDIGVWVRLFDPSVVLGTCFD